MEGISSKIAPVHGLGLGFLGICVVLYAHGEVYAPIPTEGFFVTGGGLAAICAFAAITALWRAFLGFVCLGGSRSPWWQENRYRAAFRAAGYLLVGLGFGIASLDEAPLQALVVLGSLLMLVIQLELAALLDAKAAGEFGEKAAEEERERRRALVRETRLEWLQNLRERHLGWAREDD